MSPRSLLLAAAALTAVPTASAQTTFGLRAGLNVADVTGDEIPGSEPRLGFTGGLFADIAVTPSFSIVPEVSYTQKGVSNEDDADNGHRVDYVEIPVLVKYTVPVTETGLMFGAYAGPALAFKINEEVDTDVVDVDTDFFRQTDIGAAFGVTVGAGPFAVDGRYTLGLQRATEEDSTPVDVRHGVFSIAGTYTFGR
ncbi:MAG TPA: porin family protein [Rubricoccaceae bacterium]|jgi:hypothetical protein